ncbi:MAG: hypothetical protein IT380_28470, partial [Myxococcales bacterium]|nr:hypothetical protein [Myxococcales bacterium]
MARPLFLSLAAALGCLVLVPALSACGSSKKPCSSSTCQGCCDTAGQCQT